MTVDAVWVVQHVHVLDAEEDIEDVKFIGVYSSEENAEAAVERLRKQPGFRESPDGFHIDRYALDEDNWAGGYISA